MTKNTYTPEELQAILDSHLKWLKGEEGGVRVNLANANLTNANLTNANLAYVNLTNVNLTYANLAGVNLTGKLRQFITVPSLHRKILAAIEGGGKLDMSDWHACKTTHCRGGWNVTLAGPAGAVLEGVLGTATAAALIAVVSCPALEGRVPNFYATDDEALADIRRLAALEPRPRKTIKRMKGR